MFCSNCGNRLEDDAMFCGNCGGGVTREKVIISQENVLKKTITENKEENKEKNDDSGGSGLFSLIGWGIMIWLGSKILGGIDIDAILSGKIFVDSDIRTVQGGQLMDYDYGLSIEDSLHMWFDGNEEWDTYEKKDETYVEAYGKTPYGPDGTEWQKFVFRMEEIDGRFVFIGAYDSHENYIWTTSGDIYQNISLDLINDLYGFVGMGTYELAIEAAFGNEEALETFKEIRDESL